MRRSAIFALPLAALLLWGCDVSVNRSQYLADGESSAGMTSVNGSLHIGAGCTVKGGCRSVNGRIEVGTGSKVMGLDTVNGSITVGENVTVDGDAETVNGSINIDSGSRVLGGVDMVNGSLELTGAVVNHDVSTVNGDVRLRDKSSVGGDIIVRKNRGVFSRVRVQEIRVEGGSVVEGGIDVRDRDNRVRVTIDKDSAVRGEIRNAEVIRE
jgi:DUF4097 and DUF4098 domain-containing protein YvlB